MTFLEFALTRYPRATPNKFGVVDVENNDGSIVALGIPGFAAAVEVSRLPHLYGQSLAKTLRTWRSQMKLAARRGFGGNP